MSRSEDADEPLSGEGILRRRVLKGGVAAGVTTGLVTLAGGCSDSPDRQAVCADDGGIWGRVPFRGAHQAGITTPTQAAAITAALDVLGRGPEEVRALLQILTSRIAFLAEGGPVPGTDPRLPPAGSGILGPVVFPDNLTVTVGAGASLFDARFGLAAHKPRQLVEMPSFSNDALDAGWCDGDLLLQICSNTAETNLHALRDIIKHLSGRVALRWSLEGFLPPHTVQRLGKDSIINLMGFKDGTANPDAGDSGQMDRWIWVQPDSGEPAWAAGGSYQVVRIIRNFVEFWDRTPLGEQERVMGRHKASGAPLGMQHEHDEPDFASDPDGRITPLDAHVRLANPRTPDTHKILRRSFNYSRGATRAGQLDTGLLFICFQSDLDAGFAAIQSRLNNEPLEEYIKPIGGGYYFALPGIAEPDAYLGRGLIESVV